jgi:signal transduction histidine kinase
MGEAMKALRGLGSVSAVVLLAAMLSVLVAAIPSLHLAVGGPVAATIVITARGMAELFAALLAAQRFRRTASRRDLGVAVGLGVMAVTDLVFSLGRATLAADAASAVAVLPYQLVGAGLLAAAALVPDRPLSRRGHQRLVIAGVAVIGIGVLAMQTVGLPPGERDIGGAGPLDVVPLRIVTCALLTVAAAGLGWGRRHGRDPLMRWLGAALALAALAQLQRIVVPADAAPVFTWANVLQLGAAAALVAGAIEEIRGYQRRLGELAVADERRRIARDLHDGLAQEVAFIASQSRYLAERSGGDERLELIALSAERALDDSRFVIGALTRVSGQPLGASLAMQAREFARRWGVDVTLEIQDDVDVAPEKEQAILKIVGEALSNAARHAHASTVSICLGDRDGRLYVAVHDDGRGFDADAERAAARGFGLRSMRERAQLVGGDLWLESQPGGGTRVELALF